MAQKNYHKKTSDTKSSVLKAASLPVAIAKNTVRSGIKSAISRANPFEKKINKNDVTDTGVESIRLGYQSIKQSKNTIKTVGNTIKTTKNTTKYLYKAAKVTTKITVKTVQTTLNVIANVVAVVSNPIFLIIAAFFVIVLMICSFIVLAVGGVSGTNTTKRAYSSAAGLGDTSSQYQIALQYYNTAISNRKNEFYTLINNLVYDTDNLSTSDLVYMERTSPSPTTVYQTSFATPSRKTTLQNSLEDVVSAIDVISIAYVYLEKEINAENKTEGYIYAVTYTQDVFDLLLEKVIQYNHTVYGGQRCSGGICTRQVEVRDNPDYEKAVDNVDFAASAYNDWNDIIPYIVQRDSIKDGRAQKAYWENNVQWRIDNWNYVYSSKFGNAYINNQGYDFSDFLGIKYEAYVDIMNNTSPTYEVVTYTCACAHNLHSIGLALYTADDLMSSLNFSDNDILWYELTKKGFQNLGFK